MSHHCTAKCREHVILDCTQEVVTSRSSSSREEHKMTSMVCVSWKTELQTWTGLFANFHQYIYEFISQQIGGKLLWLKCDLFMMPGSSNTEFGQQSDQVQNLRVWQTGSLTNGWLDKDALWLFWVVAISCLAHRLHPEHVFLVGLQAMDYESGERQHLLAHCNHPAVVIDFM